MAMEEAKHTAVEEFENNVAHSYVKVKTVIVENMKDFKSINIGLRGGLNGDIHNKNGRKFSSVFERLLHTLSHRFRCWYFNLTGL